ncbi:ferrous iron transport protein A [Nocardioides sp.]|uniref:FeoA family protein n=1 Tax=Nocardioides sp. TaxID=35761 RepID=UPI003513F676
MAVTVMGVAGLRRRGVPAMAAYLPGQQVGSLADLERGRPAEVCGVESADPAIAQRLLDLGFVPGTPVEMVRRAPLRDPVIYRVAGYEIALRRAQAACIRIAHAG